MGAALWHGWRCLEGSWGRFGAVLDTIQSRFDVLEHLEEILRLNLAIAHSRKRRFCDRVVEKSMFAKEIKHDVFQRVGIVLDGLEGRWSHVERPRSLSWGTAGAVLEGFGVLSELSWIPCSRDFDVLEQLEEV